MSNVQLAKDIYAAFGRGDIPTVLASFHPDKDGKLSSFQQCVDTGQLQAAMATR